MFVKSLSLKHPQPTVNLRPQQTRRYLLWPDLLFQKETILEDCLPVESLPKQQVKLAQLADQRTSSLEQRLQGG